MEQDKKCTKVQLSKKDAQSLINYLNKKKQKSKKPCRYYYCKECNSHHTSSIERKYIINKYKK